MDAVRGASGRDNVETLRSCRPGSCPVRLFVEAEVVVVEGSAVTVAGTVVCVAKQCFGGLRGKGKKGVGGKLEQPKVVLQGGRVTDNRA